MDAAALEAWYKAYTNAAVGRLNSGSDVVQAVLSDDLDHIDIESLVQRHILTTKIDEVERLCARCLHLMRHWPNLLDHVDWAVVVACEFDTEELEAGSRCGCRFCHYLFFKISAANLLDVFRKIEARLRRLGVRQTASLSVQNWVRPQPAGPQWLWVNLPGKRADHCNAPLATATKFLSNVRLPLSSALWRRPYQSELDLANVWLQNCCQFHDTCSIDKVQDLQRPTRLVSVKDDIIKLVLTAEWEVMPPYATLSYCWGTEKFMMLRSTNLTDFLMEIPYEDMPKTFQDAVLVTRKVGVDYIWIDALCIIQDSPNNVDWSHESSLMGSVYSRSRVNIAASSAKSVFEGMFTKPKLYCGGFSARVTAINDDKTAVYSCVRSFLHRNTVLESSALTHLATRAWALQEKLLPPRTLSIGDTGMFWECRDAVCSEYLPDGIWPEITEPEVRTEDTKWEWSRVASRYSAANLTYGTDRLPALSGIATRQRRITKDTYLAGMWLQDLPLQLHWQVRASTRKERPEWRAPSWSWLSIDGCVVYPRYDNWTVQESQRLIRILNAWTSPVEPSGCGAVTDGQILLLCSGLVGGHVIHGEGTIPDTFIITADQKKVHVTMDCLQITSDETVTPHVFLLPTIRGRTGKATGVGMHELEPTSISTEIPYPEGQNFYYDGDGVRFFYELHVSGLVLKQIGDEPGHFCRVGSFQLLHETHLSGLQLDTEKNQQYTHLLSALEQTGTSIAEAACVKVMTSNERPEKQYKLTIS